LSANGHRECELLALGTVDYAQAVTLQESYATRVANGEAREKFILLDHPHVITLGRGFHKENLLHSPAWLEERGVTVHESGRGGDVTYHGPGQVVGYPILNLQDRPDLHVYLRNLEELMIRTVADFGLTAGRKPGLTGIWIGDKKIGAIGVRVARWITTHGFALNVNTDLRYFEFIIPCGIREHGVTSMQKELNHEIPVKAVYDSLSTHFQDIFERELIEGTE
jgi:lipoyl(octanoyl) transferase